MSPAIVGETTPSIAAASIGSSNRYGPERPGDVDVVRVARAPGRDDRDVVEAVAPATLLALADLDLHRAILGMRDDETAGGRAAGDNWRPMLPTACGFRGFPASCGNAAMSFPDEV